METHIKTGATLAGGIASYLWGGWSQLLSTLLVFVALDYASGFIASAREGKLSSRVGGYGIARKVLIFGVVSAAYMSDLALADALTQVKADIGYDGYLIRDMTISYYLANEALSFVENLGRAGVSVPPMFKKAIEMFAEKAERQQDEQKGEDV